MLNTPDPIAQIFRSFKDLVQGWNSSNSAPNIEAIYYYDMHLAWRKGDMSSCTPPGRFVHSVTIKEGGLYEFQFVGYDELYTTNYGWSLILYKDAKGTREEILTKLAKMREIDEEINVLIVKREALFDSMERLRNRERARI